MKSQYPDKVVSLPQVQAAVRKVSKDLEGVGRVVVRPSGTEPLVRIMVESQDSAMVDKCVDYLKSVITEQAQSGASGLKPECLSSSIRQTMPSRPATLLAPGIGCSLEHCLALAGSSLKTSYTCRSNWPVIPPIGFPGYLLPLQSSEHLGVCGVSGS